MKTLCLRLAGVVLLAAQLAAAAAQPLGTPARAVVVVGLGGEHLRLVHQPAERG